LPGGNVIQSASTHALIRGLPLLLAILLGTVQACRDRGQSRTPGNVTELPLDSAAKEVDNYLQERIYGGGILASDRGRCGADTAPDTQIMLADYDVLAASRRHDTVNVLVEAYTVARFEVDHRRAYTFRATSQIGTDTLRFPVVMKDGFPQICNYPLSSNLGGRPIGFLTHGSTSIPAEWIPSTMTWERLPRLVDSLRATRGRVTPDSAAHHADAYLAGHLFGRPPSNVDDLRGCMVIGGPAAWLILADYTMLRPSKGHDTVYVKAEVIVAGQIELSRHSDSLFATEAIRTDTLIFDIIRVRKGGSPRICGYPRSSARAGAWVDFIRQGDSSMPLEWGPNSMKWDGIRRIADSIRGARGTRLP